MTSLRVILSSVAGSVLLLLLVLAFTARPAPLEPWLVDTGNPFLQCYIFPEDHAMRVEPSDYPHENALGGE